jgi:hypothetical protein
MLCDGIMSRAKKSRGLAKGALLAAVLIPLAARADVITFSLDGAEGSSPSSISETLDGVTLTYFNPSGASGFGNGNGNGPFYLESAGDGLTGFQFKFDTPVLVTAYNVYSPSSASATFDLTGPNGNALGNSLAASGDQVVNGVFLLQAQDVATLMTNFTQTDSAKLSSFTVTTAVPEPGAWGIVAGAGSLLLAWTRRRTSSRIMS